MSRTVTDAAGPSPAGTEPGPGSGRRPGDRGQRAAADGGNGSRGTASDRVPAAAPAWRRVLRQGGFEAATIMRNGEQILVTILMPVLLLIGLTKATFVAIDTTGTRIDAVTPGVLALAIMAGAFTSQAIATGFDRRNGVLRLLATTPLGRSGLVLGKTLAVLAIEAGQVVVIGAVAVALGWRPAAAGLLPAAVVALLGAAAFTALALVIAGTMRVEAVLAVANLLLILLAAGGAVAPANQLPSPAAEIAAWLPSGALGEGLRDALMAGTLDARPLLVLVSWTILLSWGAVRLFRWE